MHDPTILFDAHAHILTDDIAAYPPAPISGNLRAGVLDAPMTAARLLDEMNRHGVQRAALVQRAHVYGYDNSYVVDTAARHPDRFTAICVIDSNAHDADVRAAEWLDRGASGIRLTEPGKGADGTWLHGQMARRVWETVAQHGRSISIQLYTWNRAERLPEIPAIAAEFGSTPVIIEHLSNFIETNELPDHGVDAALDALAPLANVYLKLTTINLARCVAANVDARGVMRRIASRFPAGRLLWGSDVGQSQQSYAAMTAMARDAATGLVQADGDALLFGTAEHLFRQ